VLPGPAFGLTEDNAQLLTSPASRRDDPFSLAGRELTALHPTYVRLLIDWAALQPRAGSPPALAAPVSGCARQVGPCGAYAGVRAELAAIASQQRVSGAGSFEAVIDILGAPAWAASPVSGCESPDTPATSRPLAPGAIAGYRELIAALVSLARSEGVELRWWSPWNEPNDPRFISPQRERCEVGSTSLSPAVYAELARAMAAELRVDDAGARLVLGELGGLTRDSPHATSIASFVASLPGDVVCLGPVWSVHAYASYGRGASAEEPVSALEEALDGRGGCASRPAVWVTEAGAGAPHPGAPRDATGREELEGCRALAAQLERWSADPRVRAVFQYGFREDPAFPVGLLSPDLERTYPAYRLWLSLSRTRAAGEKPRAPAAACAA
jgi:hypothetical protein